MLLQQLIFVCNATPAVNIYSIQCRLPTCIFRGEVETDLFWARRAFIEGHSTMIITGDCNPCLLMHILPGPVYVCCHSIILHKYATQFLKHLREPYTLAVSLVTLFSTLHL